jgi:MATE family multidrug resistance protein
MTQMAVHVETKARLLPERTRGGLREVITLAYPVIATNMSATLIHTVDSAMVGRLGATHLAAVGYALIWYWTAVCFFVGAASGVQTFVSQLHGAGDRKACGAWTWHGIYAVVPVAGICIAFFAAGAEPLFRLMGPSVEVQKLAAAYVHGRVFGVPGLVAAMAIAAFFRGIGDTRTPLYAMVAANIVNIVLDYGLIFGRLGLPDWGIAGAGVATGVAEWVYFGVLVYALRRPRLVAEYRTARAAFDTGALRRYARISAPIGGQWMLEMLSFAVFASLVARMGDIEMASSQAMLVLQHMSFMQVMAVSVAATTLVGRYRGMGDFAAAERSHSNALGIGVSIALFVSILFMCFPELMLRIFTDDDAVLRLGSRLLVIGALFQTCDAIGVVASGSLRGAGDTRWPFVVQASLAWGLFLPSAWLFGLVLDGGVEGAWMGGVLYLGVLGVVLLRRFRRGEWQRMKI